MRICLILLLSVLTACTRTGADDAGTVTMALDLAPGNLDPRIGTDATSERLIQLIYSSLSWETPDPTTYIFHLRDGVKFHDGRRLTARDVVFTFRSMLSGAIRTPKTGAYRAVQSVEAPDDRTVIFKLKEPFSPFLWNLTRGAIGIVPEGSPPNIGFAPIGSGEFRLVRYVQDGEVVLQRFDDYYDRKPTISVVRFKIIPDTIVRALELRKGSVDIALNVLSPDMVDALRGNPQLDIVESPGTAYQYLAFNLRDPIFRDLRVRKAIAYAVDREKIVQHLFRGEARLATGVIPPNNWCYEPNVTVYPYDPERAKQLLREAGYSNLSFTYRTSTDQDGRILASVLQQQLKEIGVNMEIRSNEFATFYADVQKGNFQLYSLRWIGGNNDPDIFNFVFHSKSFPPNGANRGFYSNPEVDRLIEIGRRDADVSKRKEAYQAIQRIVADDLPYVSLWHPSVVAVYNKRISGMKLYPAGEYAFLSDIRVSDVRLADAIR
jgi:peptide/nickel transport system substrate-binding protein